MTSFSVDFAAYRNQKPAYTRGKICYAADSAMYFGQNGLVHACCYNRTQVFGRYPEQSVDAIWNSAVRKQMAATMTSSCLADGCQTCEIQLKAGNYDGLLAALYDKTIPRPPLWRLGQRAKSPNMPTTLHFELSNLCNLECTMCTGFFSSSIRRNREQLPPLPNMYDSAFVEQLRPYLPGLHTVKFFGGEPFLIPIYHEIWDALCDLNPHAEIQITTNGTVYNEKVKHYLDKLNTYIIVSIDSFVKETYESIRINAKYERVMENLLKFNDHARARGKNISVAVCPMTTNAMEMPEMVKFCNDHKISIFFNTVQNPHSLSIENMSAHEIRAIVEKYQAARPSLVASDISGNLFAFDGLIAQLQTWQAHAEGLQQEQNQRYIDSASALSPREQVKKAIYMTAQDNFANPYIQDSIFLDQAKNRYTDIKEYTKDYFEEMYILVVENKYLSNETLQTFKSVIDSLCADDQPSHHWDTLAAVTLKLSPSHLIQKLLRTADIPPGQRLEVLNAAP